MRGLFILEGARFFLRSLRVRLAGFKKYSGNADSICKKAVASCWNGRFFQTSAGHFRQFYTRDFGWCAESLMKLGYEEEVTKTLEYAIEVFRQNRRITAAITPSGKAFDFPVPAPDSIPYLMRSIEASENKYLIDANIGFFNHEIQRYFDLFIDKKTGLVKKGHFSSMKDHAVRQSSCYDNAMAGMLADILEKHPRLDNPFSKYDYRKLIKGRFWTGRYFLDDLSGKKHVAGDANVFPFWAGLFGKDMMKSAFNEIQKAGLDIPFPLKYTRKDADVKFVRGSRFFAPRYELDTLWMHMGPIYVKLLKSLSRKRAEMHKKEYRKMIEKHRTFLELYTPEGEPYRTPFYYTDEAMLWAANYLTL